MHFFTVWVYLMGSESVLSILQYIHTIELPQEPLVGTHLTDFGLMGMSLMSLTFASLDARHMYIQQKISERNSI